MRVAIDARRLQDRPLTGVGRWLSHVVASLTADLEVVLLTDARRPGPDAARPDVGLRVPAGAPEIVWLQVAVARWLRTFDGLFHGAFNAIPFLGTTPSVVSLYDLSFEHHPEDFRPAKRALFRAQARFAAARSRAILTVSEFSRQCIEETYRVAPERVVVAPVAVDPVFSPARRADAAALLAPVGVRGRYVVALGGARRRGLDVAVNAWRAVRGTAREPDLVVVGSEAPPADDGLIYAGPVDDRTWATLLAGAEAFCYPTRYEGFGLPALEAAASGVPVVCAPVASLPEILGDAAEWSSDTGPHAVALALRRVLTDDARRAELSAAGVARAATGPRWDEIATRVTAAYAMAAGWA